jgi:toxin YoeB
MPDEWVTIFQPQFIDDLDYWAATKPATLKKIFGLMREIRRTPFEGTGQVERLKHLDENTWSRRINQVDRLVYRVTGNQIDFLQARKHY